MFSRDWRSGHAQGHACGPRPAWNCNGGHTYAAIRDTIENADEVTRASLERAHVRLHLLQGVDDSKVAEIAEGLNRSKQVDDPSLANL
ncbi:MAG: AIPR family protein [Alphaproteobacteria bacterium]|nr:AIPR family protein [Alphaproteobacteria bacterium]